MVSEAVILVHEVSIETIGWIFIAMVGWCLTMLFALMHDLKAKYIRQTNQVGKYYDWNEKRKQQRNTTSLLRD